MRYGLIAMDIIAFVVAVPHVTLVVVYAPAVAFPPVAIPSPPPLPAVSRVVRALGDAAQVGVGPGGEVGRAGGIRQRGGDGRHHEGIGHRRRRARDRAARVNSSFRIARGDVARVTGSGGAANGDNATQLVIAGVARGRGALASVVAGPEDRERRPVRAAGRADALRGVGHLGPGAAVLVGDGDGLIRRLQEQQQNVVARDSRKARAGEIVPVPEVTAPAAT